MTQKKVNLLADYGATLIGLLVAISNAWLNIDWINFDIKKEYPKLVLSAIIAISGYISTVKLNTKTNV